MVNMLHQLPKVSVPGPVRLRWVTVYGQVNFLGMSIQSLMLSGYR